MNYDHILVIGFGGPEKPEDMRPFIENVTRGIPIPEERLREVEQHYQAVGGVSPYNESVLRLSDKLREFITLPIFVGMRNWHPFLKDTITEIKNKGLRKGIGIILAPHRSEASYEKYTRAVEEAKKNVDAIELEYEYLKSWYDHPRFIEAQVEGMRVILRPQAEESEVLRLAQDDRAVKNVPVVFSAHSIPVEMAQRSKYVGEVTASSELVAKHLGLSKWQVAWQSRTCPSTGSGRGSPRQPWLEPDVITVIRDLKSKGENTVVVVPIGFLCDNVEVLYDLDVEAKQAAEKLGLKYFRASTVMDHPKFVGMLAEMVQDGLCEAKKSTVHRP